ncbi:MAG: primosomal protein N', partial [Gammaproteobacteria bacterium]|nr:primosomal protein N' [Gammaproteobacteria bacterium]
MAILRVAVAAPVYSIFDYLPPVGCDLSQLHCGVRVRVPFGRGERCGVLLQVASESPLQSNRLKRVLEILDDQALFSAEDIALLRWAADYYRYPPGEVFASALPARLRKGTKDKGGACSGWRLTPLGGAVDPDELNRAPRQAELMKLLSHSPEGMTQQDIALNCGSCTSVLRKLEQRGWLEKIEIRAGNDAHPVSITEAAPDLNEDQRKAVDKVVAGLAGFGVFLLDGVTGSGKTEVYLELVKKVGAQGGQ